MRDPIPALRAILESGPPMRLAMLFGSVARELSGRGVARADSDLDVAIWPARELSLSEENDLAARMEEATGRDVDIVRIDQAGLGVAFRVARDGVEILADSPATGSRWRASIASEHADFEPLLAAGLERYRRAVLRGHEVG